MARHRRIVLAQRGRREGGTGGKFKGGIGAARLRVDDVEVYTGKRGAREMRRFPGWQSTRRRTSRSASPRLQLPRPYARSRSALLRIPRLSSRSPRSDGGPVGRACATRPVLCQCLPQSISSAQRGRQPDRLQGHRRGPAFGRGEQDMRFNCAMEMRESNQGMRGRGKFAHEVARCGDNCVGILVRGRGGTIAAGKVVEREQGHGFEVARRGIGAGVI